MDQALENGWIRKASHNGYQLNVGNANTVVELSRYLKGMVEKGMFDAYPWIYLDTFDTRIDRSFETSFRFTAEAFAKMDYNLIRVFGASKYEVH